MKRLLAVVALGLLVPAGCRSGGKHGTDLLERDLRTQENRIYELEDQLDECEAELETVRHENDELKAGKGAKDTSTTPRRSPSSPSLGLPRTPETPARPRSPTRREPDETEPTIEPPVIEGVPPATPGAEPSTMPKLDSGALRRGRPATIVLNKQLTGGLHGNGGPGTQGITVAFEPRDAQGRLVEAPGDVAVVVMDPSQHGRQARIARWDIKAHELRARRPGGGFQLQLPWPGGPPANRELHLFVRYISPDGQKLQADTKLDFNPGGASPQAQVATWAAAPPRAVPAQTAAVASSVSGTSEEPGGHSAVEDTVSEPDPPQALVAAKPQAKRDASRDARPDKPVWQPYR